MYGSLKVKHIVAVSENRVIGRSGGMPWHISEDFKFFKETTMAHPMIMGRKTWDSIGRVLPGRQTIVVSRNFGLQVPTGVIIVKSVEQALAWCESSENKWGNVVFIVGGGEIYRQTLPWVDQIYLTEVLQVCDGDTFYPEISPVDFEESIIRERLEAEIPFKIKLFTKR